MRGPISSGQGLLRQEQIAKAFLTPTTTTFSFILTIMSRTFFVGGNFKARIVFLSL